MKRPSILLILQRAALLAWVALLPLQTRWFLSVGRLGGGTWEYGTKSLYATDLLLVVAVILTLFLQRSTFFQRPHYLPAIIPILSLSVLAAALLSTFSALSFDLAIWWWLRLGFGFLAFWTIVKSDIRVVWIAVALVASASIEAIIALVQFSQQSIGANTLFGLASHSPSVAGDAVVETSIGRFLRAYGTLPHPNILGGWMALGLIACSTLYLRSYRKVSRVVLLMLFSVIGMGLLLTFSRSATLAWALAILSLVAIVLVREMRHPARHLHLGFRSRDVVPGLKMMKLVMASILLFGAFTLVFSPLISARTNSDNRLEQISVTERVHQYDDAKKILTKYWIFGVGVGNYTKALHDEVNPSQKSFAYQPVHNVLLLQFAELGILGLLIILWAGVQIVRLSIRSFRSHWRSSEHAPWVFFTSAALLALFSVGLFDHYLWSLPFGVMVSWLTLAWWGKSIAEEK